MICFYWINSSDLDLFNIYGIKVSYIYKMFTHRVLQILLMNDKMTKMWSFEKYHYNTIKVDGKMPIIKL